jgi:ethanolamine ammonia-lyase large subunit
MPPLDALDAIPVPPPRPDVAYTTTLLDRRFAFPNLKALLGAADWSKAGDRAAGLAAPDEATREAARSILSSLTLEHLHDHPLLDARGRVDAVMRVNYAIDRAQYDAIRPLTLGALKDRLMAAPAAEVQRIGAGLTGVMAAALAKLLDVHELVYVAKKCKQPVRARTQVGARGTLSSRLQPNHPTDSIAGMTALLWTGLSMGSGDALLGMNPAIDTVDNVCALLHALDRARRATGAPTQICVLSHVKTQLAALERGAPVEILFQSLAGTERVLTEEFDIAVALLDDAYERMRTRGPLASEGAERMLYFETGQGSEFTYGKHEGIDMTTTEALCYGLARRWRPFMVNNVTGFIGPETHLDNFEMITSNLQDHFMGKLLGLPMGMAPCWTLHAQVTLEGQQIATQLLTAAGANYYMDVYLNTDRMLAYFDTSGHDDQTLREVHGLAPAPEFLAWAKARGIFEDDGDGGVRRGPRWGDPTQFCASAVEWQALRDALPAAYGFDNAGPRPANRVTRTARANQAVAREAIHADLRVAAPDGVRLRALRTAAASRDAHLAHPDLGARLDPTDAARLTRETAAVQVLISDGLSAEAVHHNLPNLLPVLLDGLAAHEIGVGDPYVATFGRVKLAEALADATGARVVVHLIGERPGGDAAASRSLSAYIAYRVADGAEQRDAAAFSGHADVRFEYTVVSNIYSAGLPPLEAGSLIAEKVIAILAHGAAGHRLEQRLAREAA